MPLVMILPLRAGLRHGYGPGAISYLNTKKPDQAYLGSILIARAQSRKSAFTSRASRLKVHAPTQLPAAISNGFMPSKVSASPFEFKAKLLVYEVDNSKSTKVSFAFDSKTLVSKARTSLMVSSLKGSRCAVIVPGNTVRLVRPSNFISI